MSKTKENKMEITVKTPEEINNLSEFELDKYVNDCSVRILEKISDSEEKIKEAEDKANQAKYMAAYGAKEHLMNFFTGGNYTRDKKATVTAEGLVKTNEAISEMNDLLQEIIGFVCLSLHFAQKMNESINHMIEVGFTGRDGQFHELTEGSKKIARKVLQESYKYAQNQIEFELRHKQQDEKIQTNFMLASDNKSRLNEKDILDKEQSEKIYSLSNENKEQNKRISELHTSISEKDKIDAEQTKRLEELVALIDNKDLVDRKQEEAISKNMEAIQVLAEYIKQKDILDKEQSEEIKRLNNTSSRKLCITAIVISSCSIICSIVSIILKFIM
ncbi:hypothetical protein [Treponema putidum]|uniref:hypothetical protein n=1 Tax=Treponema putidum TaxID=221027 RepID=UPI003D90A4DB